MLKSLTLSPSRKSNRGAYNGPLTLRRLLTLETRTITQIIPYDRNPRKNKAAVDRVLESLNRHGQIKPIVLSAKGKPFEQETVCAGHTTLEALKRFGAKEVKVVVKEFADEAQFLDFNIRDNKVSEFAEWDEQMLADLGAEFNVDLVEMGFDFDIEEEESEGLTDEDDVPETPEEPTAKLGQIWKLGDHRLMCGDSTSIDEVNQLLENKRADMVHTDPPYGVSYQSNMRTESDKFEVIKNDDVFLDIAPVIDACSSGWCFVWTSWKVLTKWIDLFSSFGYPTNQVIWAKGGGGIGDLKRTFSSDYETALVWHRGAELTGKRIGSVWKVDKDGAGTYVHPTQKPVALPEEAIDKTTCKGQTVLDLFGGSGSTLIACEKTNRKCRMMELDPKYCDVIIKRWEDFTGKKAELINAI